jgi:hypothetical protein
MVGLAQLAHVHWFFGNLYEAVVKVPDLLASRRRVNEQPTPPLKPGSPVLYYAAAAPATLPPLLVASVTGWDDRGSRRWLLISAVCSSIGVATTAHLVRAINIKMFFSARALTEKEEEDLLRSWYRFNAVRLAAIGGAWLAARKARSRLAR